MYVQYYQGSHGLYMNIVKTECSLISSINIINKLHSLYEYLCSLISTIYKLQTLYELLLRQYQTLYGLLLIRNTVLHLHLLSSRQTHIKWRHAICQSPILEPNAKTRVRLLDSCFTYSDYLVPKATLESGH